MTSCWKCGRENPAGMRFCTHCGAAISDATPAGGAPDSSSFETLSLPANPQTAPTNWPNFAESYKAQTPPVAEPKKSKTGLIIGIIAALAILGLVVVAGGIGYYYYSKSDGEVTNGNSNQGVYNANIVDEDANSNSSPTPKASPSPTPSPTPEQLFAPPTEPTKDGTFTIYANEGWQLSQIAVVPEEKYTTTVEGIVDLAGAKAGVRAGGTKEEQYKSRRLFPEWPTGALLMRTRYADGRFSNTLPVSAAGATGYWENLPDERGMLEFRINDNSPQNNGGQFTIRKKHTSVPKKRS